MASVFKYTSRSLNVITNTVITSRMGNLSQQFGHSHIALVHENANSGYWSKDMFRHSLNADLCVFPGKGVANAAGVHPQVRRGSRIGRLDLSATCWQNRD